MRIRPPRAFTITVGVVVALVVVLVVGLHVAGRQLQPHVQAALGPRASVGSIGPGWTGIVLRDVRIQAPPGWPVKDELRAARVTVLPDLRSLFGGPWRVARVTVEGGYLSALRMRNGRMRLLPALLEDRGQPASRSKPAPAGGAPEIEIRRAVLDGATIEFFDHSVRSPPLALRIEKLDAEAGPFMLPKLDRSISVQVAGVFKGPQRDGRIAIDGDFTPSTRDADLRARFTGVDMVPLQHYVLKGSDTAIEHGALDLDLRAKVARGRLSAPGKLTLTDLELVDDGPLATFAGVPRKAVLAAMTERGRLEVKFTLQGRLDDPSFSINENLATRIAAGVAESLGVSLSGAVKGLGGLVKGLLGR
jgi:hypothetical protein